MKSSVQNYLNKTIKRYPILNVAEQQIVEAFQLLVNTYDSGGKLLCAGNGGSAADAEHIVGELMKGFYLKRPLSADETLVFEEIGGEEGKRLAQTLQKALPTVSLVGNFALQSAFSNDVASVCYFAQQIYGLGTPGDVFLGISTSGNSKNVILAAVAARAKEMRVIGLTGAGGGALRDYTDVCICAPAQKVDEIQELHLPIYHCLCAMLESHYFLE